MGLCCGVPPKTTDTNDGSASDQPKNTNTYEKPTRPPPLTPPEEDPYPVQTQAESAPELGFVTCMHDFEAVSDAMLSFNKGDILEIINKEDDNWWLARHPNTKLEAYIPVTFIAASSSLLAQDWYFADIPRVQAEQLLLSDLNTNGAFLIRLHHTGTSYAISARTFKEGSDKPRVKHFHISVSESGLFHFSGSKGFHTLNDLVDYHFNNKSSEVGWLLQHSCKRPTPSLQTAFPPPEDRFEVDRTWITFDDKIGKGNFGDVFLGSLKDVKVAIKTLREGTMTKEQFLEEARIMKDLQHPNILSLYAVCTNNEPILIMTELMKEGALLDFLRKEDRPALDTTHFVYIVAQVASGMAYIEEKYLIHRDLAARNVLLGPSLLCKIADFGLARICYDEYNPTSDTRFPVRWTAPEAVTRGKFSIKSDVWSFGIVMYEVVTNGAIPYVGMSNVEVMEHVERGSRISQPRGCEPAYYQLMLECWKYQAMDRPSFVYLQDYLRNYDIQSASSYYG